MRVGCCGCRCLRVFAVVPPSLHAVFLLSLSRPLGKSSPQLHLCSTFSNTSPLPRRRSIALCAYLILDDTGDTPSVGRGKSWSCTATATTRSRFCTASLKPGVGRRGSRSTPVREGSRRDRCRLLQQSKHGQYHLFLSCPRQPTCCSNVVIASKAAVTSVVDSCSWFIGSTPNLDVAVTAVDVFPARLVTVLSAPGPYRRHSSSRMAYYGAPPDGLKRRKCEASHGPQRSITRPQRSITRGQRMFVTSSAPFLCRSFFVALRQGDLGP